MQKPFYKVKCNALKLYYSDISQGISYDLSIYTKGMFFLINFAKPNTKPTNSMTSLHSIPELNRTILSQSS